MTYYRNTLWYGTYHIYRTLYVRRMNEGCIRRDAKERNQSAVWDTQAVLPICRLRIIIVSVWLLLLLLSLFLLTPLKGRSTEFSLRLLKLAFGVHQRVGRYGFALRLAINDVAGGRYDNNGGVQYQRSLRSGMVVSSSWNGEQSWMDDE